MPRWTTQSPAWNALPPRSPPGTVTGAVAHALRPAGHDPRDACMRACARCGESALPSRRPRACAWRRPRAPSYPCTARGARAAPLPSLCGRRAPYRTCRRMRVRVRAVRACACVRCVRVRCACGASVSACACGACECVRVYVRVRAVRCECGASVHARLCVVRVLTWNLCAHACVRARGDALGTASPPLRYVAPCCTCVWRGMLHCIACLGHSSTSPSMNLRSSSNSSVPCSDARTSADLRQHRNAMTTTPRHSCGIRRTPCPP